MRLISFDKLQAIFLNRKRWDSEDERRGAEWAVDIAEFLAETEGIETEEGRVVNNSCG